jgi:hypothetical protein
MNEHLLYTVALYNSTFKVPVYVFKVFTLVLNAKICYLVIWNTPVEIPKINVTVIWNTPVEIPKINVTY